MSSRKFHHGNLRAELVELATAELVSGRPEDLSLRDLAARLGVSPAAPYRHFSSKEELLEAVAAAGLGAVVGAYEAAMSLRATPKEKLRRACQAYLDLAETNPGLFNLLFFTELYVQREGEGRSAGSAFGIFEKLVASAYGVTKPRQVRSTALAAWSLIHGFAILKMQGRVKRFAGVAQTEQDVLEIVCNGLAVPG